MKKLVCMVIALSMLLTLASASFAEVPPHHYL